jgi:hypothetical protein
VESLQRDDSNEYLDMGADKFFAAGYLAALETLQRERNEAVRQLNRPQHWNLVYNTDPVQRACSELPLGWEIQACMENGAGWVNLCNPRGDRIEFDCDADQFDWKIHAAIDAAIKQGSEG